MALIGDQETLPVDLEITRPGVKCRAVIAEQEESIAVDGQIQRVVGKADIALGKLLGDPGQAYPLADGITTGPEQAAGVNIGKLRP